MDSTGSDVTSQRVAAFTGQLGPMYRIHLVNVALTIVTLGIYRFWAKTRMRRYLWSHLEVGGDRLEYTGTAKELFLGFLIVFGAILLPIFIVPSIVLPFVAVDYPWAGTIVGAAQGLLIAFLIPIAVWRARRYRLSRTRWRGMRGALTGSAAEYAGRYIAYGILQAVTLLLAAPVVRNKLAHYAITNVHVGDTPFAFAGRAKPMYGALAKAVAWFLAASVACGALVTIIVVLHVSGATKASPIWMTFPFLTSAAIAVPFFIPILYYAARETIYFVSVTAFGPIGFRLAAGPWRVVWLNVSNLVIVLASVGLAMPWVYKRTLVFYAERLHADGDLGALVLQQSDAQGPGVGEGLADAFDPAGF